jgi:hypothetical protein
MGGATGFHAGELVVQERAGTRGEAQRLAGMLDRPDLRGGVGGFLADRTLAGLAARDAAGRLWVSPLTGAPGFLDASGATTLRVHTVPGPGDPLRALPADQPVGLIALEFARRRRVRVNGTLTAVDASGLTVDVEQAYGNCPQYIQQRELAASPGEEPGPVVEGIVHGALEPEDVGLVEAADTFLLGTTHPERGNDASHRGGSPGFVRVADQQRLWWPDYPGNNLFNSFGNLEVDPTAALLFVDFATGRILHLTGSARVEWSTGPGDDGGTGRRVWFDVEAVVAGSAAELRAESVERYRRNPALT